MKKFKLGLLPRIVIAIVLGICLGGIMPVSLERVFMTFNGIFSQFLGFLIPLIIVGLVTPAIGEIGHNAGKMLLVTVVIAYLDTLFSGFFSYFTSSSLFPTMISSSHVSQFAKAVDVAPYFNINIPPLMDVMSSLVLAFILGLGIAYLNCLTMHELFSEFKAIVGRVIEKVIIPLLPLYIFGIFMNMTRSGQASKVLTVFAAIIVVIFAMHILLLVFQFCMASLFVHRNPFRLLGNMMPAYFTALGTSSSAATIPVTLKSTVKNGVNEHVAGFVIPLCATIHLSGSEMKITACAVALMLMEGMPFSFGMFAGFICMLGVFMVAAPGVPGGAIMAALGVLSSMLGFGPSEQALMIALYITMDSFGTACNVTGDGAIALVMDKFFAK